MNTQISIPYTKDSSLYLSKDDKNIVWQINLEVDAPAIDVKDVIVSKLDNPIGTPPLSELLKNKRKILVLVDDNTRSTPQWIIQPLLIDYIKKAGVKAEDITIMVCLGTHRALSEAEIEERVSTSVYKEIRCINLPQNIEAFDYHGKTELGISIYLSKICKEYDFMIAVGNIIPHMYAGWAGGAKMIQPGITSSITTAETHLMAALQIDKILGDENNPVRLEMEKIARIAGLGFIVNTVMNDNGEITGLFCGDVVDAHRAGVEFARPAFTRRIPNKASIVVAGARPANRDLWQGFKPLNNCGKAVKDGGVLVLVIDASEGIAKDHLELIELSKFSPREVLEMHRRGETRDGVAVATVLAFMHTRERINIILVSDGIDKASAESIGCRWASTIEEAVRDAIIITGSDDIGVVQMGADIIVEIG